jgi:arsenate reductase
VKVDSVPKPSILFLCTGNSARSQMAEAFLRKHGADRFDAYSAGVNPIGLNPLTIQVMQEAGIDLSGERSKGFDEYVGKMSFQYLITLCDDAERNCPAGWPGVNTRLHWAFEDPSSAAGTDEEKIAVFREVRDQIEKRIVDWLASAQGEA